MNILEISLGLKATFWGLVSGSALVIGALFSNDEGLYAANKK